MGSRGGVVRNSDTKGRTATPAVGLILKCCRIFIELGLIALSRSDMKTKIDRIRRCIHRGSCDSRIAYQLAQHMLP